jgi:hypothetical protein
LVPSKNDEAVTFKPAELILPITSSSLSVAAMAMSVVVPVPTLSWSVPDWPSAVVAEAIGSE